MKFSKKQIIGGVSALALAGAGIVVWQTGAVAAPNAAQARCVIQGQPTVCYPLDRNSVASGQVVDNSLIMNDFHPLVRAAINNPAGKVLDVEADGPYPGATKLQDLPGGSAENGSNSTAKVPGDSGAAAHTVWVKCPTGKIATGGGFRLAADASLAAKKAVHVVASEAVGEPIEGDAAGSLLPIGWQVEVINDSAADIIVRPWVTCVEIG